MRTDKTIEEELKEAMIPAEEEPGEVVEVETPEPEEIEAPTEIVPAEKEPEVKEAEIKSDAPVALSGAIKAKWKDLPPDVQAEWKKREDDIHRMMTAKEGELNLGRSIKEIAAPYEAIIRSEGGTVEGAFKDLLNTAYVLRTGTPQQKANLLLTTAQQYGVDLRGYMGQQQQNPLSTIQQEIQQLRQMADPNRIKSQLQEEMERDRINGEIQAFAAIPAHVHFEAVKSTMGALISLSLIHISEPTRLLSISYAVFCLQQKKQKDTNLI